MPDLTQALERLPHGSKVRLELADGSSVEGVVNGLQDEKVTFRNHDAVEAAEVRDLVVVRRSDGPE